ncbi:MAG: YdeI/OmpD-associated family protein [Chloroflexota bacterium]|nr:YdeI/OmpD-associated family protein [Chloroflexota bacterium]
MKTTFTTTVKAMTEKATTLPVPAAAVAALGTQKKPRVLVSLNGYTYRNTVQLYNGNFMLPFSADDRKGAGVKAGDDVEVTLELDLEPPTVMVPDDLAAALAAQAGLPAIFAGLAFSKRKEFVRQVEDAKTPETRERRIAGVLAKLTDA